tara:strand:+ start:227 stop:715 length:489 start_codon:yes stop_codon:yes gene_type:complete
MNIPIKYIPKSLSYIDKIKQMRQIKKSRKAYKTGKYIHRKPVNSFISKKSQHIIKAEKIYKVKPFKIDKNLVKATGCTRKALNKIVKKGQGAYYSSGSRPNQTAHSWGYARMASSITSGKAALIDYNILQEGCNTDSKALKLAKKARKYYGYGRLRSQKIKI